MTKPEVEKCLADAQKHLELQQAFYDLQKESADNGKPNSLAFANKGVNLAAAQITYYKNLLAALDGKEIQSNTIYTIPNKLITEVSNTNQKPSFKTAQPATKNIKKNDKTQSKRKFYIQVFFLFVGILICCILTYKVMSVSPEEDETNPKKKMNGFSIPDF